MDITFSQVLIWILIAALVGVVGELLARQTASSVRSWSGYSPFF